MSSKVVDYNKATKQCLRTSNFANKLILNLDKRQINSLGSQFKQQDPTQIIRQLQITQFYATKEAIK